MGRIEALKLAAERKAREQDEIERALGRSGIPLRFQGRGFDAYREESEEQKVAKHICQRYAGHFSTRLSDGSSLILTGRPGTGKTHLACAILASVIAKGYAGLFITVSEALRLIRDAYSPRAQRSEIEAFALLTRPALLVLDEVGIAIGSDEKRKAILFDVLNTRYANRLPTILIANLTVSELQGYLGERIMDRLQESGSAVVAFTWQSYRQGFHRV